MSQGEISIHILVPDASSQEELSLSTLASTRLRLATAATTLVRGGKAKVTVGPIPQTNSELIVVGKIGADNVVEKTENWLRALDGARRQGSKILVDFTDDHLSCTTSMSPFYRSVLQLVDMVTVPSSRMQTTLSESPELSLYPQISLRVVPDALEYDLVRPRKGRGRVAAWFGHGTNLKYLVDYIGKGLRPFLTDCLIVCTDPLSIHNLQQITKNIRSTKVIGVPWTVANLRKALLTADFALLPVGKDDPKKKGAGPNRLLTSLCLGLPVITQGIESYNEFSRFYTDLQEENFEDFSHNYYKKCDLVIEAQELILPKYSQASVGTHWQSLILELLGS